MVYIGEWKNGVIERKMSHLACFCIGMFALQAKLDNSVRKERFFAESTIELEIRSKFKII